MHELSEEQKRQLLQFTTGSDRVPIGGLSQLKLVIARNGFDSDRYLLLCWPLFMTSLSRSYMFHWLPVAENHHYVLLLGAQLFLPVFPREYPKFPFEESSANCLEGAGGSLEKN